MGKIKALAKYRISGSGSVLLFSFLLMTVVSVLLGDFSFLISSMLETLGVSFSSVGAKNTVSAALSVIGMILIIFSVSPLRLGCERWFLKSAAGKKASFKEFFYYFSPGGIIKSVKAVIFCSLKKTAALTLLLFPSACLASVLYFSFKEGEISLYISYALVGFTALLFLTGMLFYFIYTARYFAYYSIIVSNETIRPDFAFEKSAEITEGAYAKICFFRLSFLPWFLLCLLIFPTFYIWGYYKESKIMLCVSKTALYRS